MPADGFGESPAVRPGGGTDESPKPWSCASYGKGTNRFMCRRLAELIEVPLLGQE